MRRDCARWYAECAQCAQSKAPPSRPRGHLQKVTTGAPLDIVVIDLLSGLPATPEGYKYLLVITDYFTKWTEAYPLVDSKAHTYLYVSTLHKFLFPLRNASSVTL